MQHKVCAGAEDSPSRVPASLCAQESTAKWSGQTDSGPFQFPADNWGCFFLLIRSLLTTLGRGEGRGAALGSCELSAGVGNSQESHGVSLAIVLCFGV